MATGNRVLGRRCSCPSVASAEECLAAGSSSKPLRSDPAEERPWRPKPVRDYWQTERPGNSPSMQQPAGNHRHQQLRSWLASPVVASESAGQGGPLGRASLPCCRLRSTGLVTVVKALVRERNTDALKCSAACMLSPGAWPPEAFTNAVSKTCSDPPGLFGKQRVDSQQRSQTE